MLSVIVFFLFHNCQKLFHLVCAQMRKEYIPLGEDYKIEEGLMTRCNLCLTNDHVH